MPHRFIFATRADLEPGIRAVEAQHPLKYVEYTFHLSFDVPIYKSALGIPELGIERARSVIASDSYLILPTEVEIFVRKSPQADGAMYYVNRA
jgi:hypothetical protein